jgi:hypothetical protein
MICAKGSFKGDTADKKLKELVDEGGKLLEKIEEYRS